MSEKCQFDILKSLKKLKSIEVELQLEQLKDGIIFENIITNLPEETTIRINLKEKKAMFSEICAVVN